MKTKVDAAGRSVYSKSKDWCTPFKYVQAVKDVFGGSIDLDPCSNKDSIVQAKIEYIFPFKNGLIEDWNYKTIYVNPPYGADRERNTTIKDWIKKCACTYEQFHSQIIALVPVATNTTHWKYYIFGSAKAICFLADTRLKFLVNGSEENKGAPMACCMVYWGDNFDRFKTVFNKHGAVVDISETISQCKSYECSEQALF